MIYIYYTDKGRDSGGEILKSESMEAMGDININVRISQNTLFLSALFLRLKQCFNFTRRACTLFIQVPKQK